MKPPCIEIFQHGDFGGNSFRLAPGRYSSSGLNFGSIGDNALSSLKVPGELTVILYDELFHTGKEKVFNNGEHGWVGDDFNDQTSSIEVLRPVEIFGDGDFGGSSVKLGPGKYDYTQFSSVGNDKLSSLKVPVGLSVRLYEHGDFQGRYKDFNGGDHRWVSDDFNDQTSSIEIRVLRNGGSANDTITAGSKDAILNGGDGNDILNGGDGNDILNGGADQDTLNGGKGNDTFVISKTWTATDKTLGNDTLNGGEGIDTFDVSQWESSFTVRLDSLNPGSATSGNITQRLFSIENVIGSNFDDSIYGDGLANRLEGNGGNDLIEGGSGNDILRGGLGNDTLDGEMDSDRVIETGDVNFTLSVVNILNDINNTHQLTGLGTDTLRNIETVELQGGASNNTLDASLATFKVKLEGLGGNDTLKGGFGDDTLAGGAGTNYLWGGRGQDTFATEAGGIQIIKDFERGVDKIDMAQAQVNQISFDFSTIQGSTIIKVNGAERARVEGSLVDSSSLINTSNDIKPQPLTAAQVNNLSEMLQKWAESYAQSLGLSTNNVKLVSNNLQMVGGDLTFVDWGTQQTQTNQGLKIENMTRNASMLFRNNSTVSSSVTFTYSDGKGYQITNQNTSQWTTGGILSGSVATKVKAEGKIPFTGIGVTNETTITVGYQQSWSIGGSTTEINTDNVNRQQTTSYTFNAPGGTVTKAIATATGGEYSGGKYEIPITISGTIGIDLNGDGDALDTNEINNLPVNAILQYYNPQQFVGEGFQRTFSLLQGQVLFYNETTKAKVTGTADGAFFNRVEATTRSAYDRSLTNPTTSEYENGVNYQQVGQGVEERYWLIRGSQYGSRPSGATLRIEGFTPAEDFIGIDHNAIKSNTDILLATNLATGIDPADKLILKAGSYTKNNITYQTTQILMGGTGSNYTTINDNHVLAELIGVTPNQLLGSSRESLTRDNMTSNFMFGTQGTIWDNTLASSNGTSFLQLLATV